MVANNLLPTGTRLGAFEIEGHIASGGMGAVYAAHNVLTQEKRALKVMLPELVARPDFVERFIREIRLAMMVQHPNLVKVFEPGLDGDMVFLPMELLTGQTLTARLRRAKRLPPNETVGLLEAIGSAVAALHAIGIAHRDLKPSNFFLSIGPNGECVPKLLDLGAARNVELGTEVTSTGMAIGSPHYMSPEQAAGRKDVDVRTDQYSLGVAAYQMLTGARPYENDDTGHVISKVLAGAPFKRPREIDPAIPPQLEAVIMRALERDPAARFASVTEMITQLHASLDDEKTIALPAPPTLEDATRIQPVEAPQPKRASVLSGLPDPGSGTAKPAVMAAPPQKTGNSMNVIALIFGVIGLGVAGWIVYQNQAKPIAPTAATTTTVTAAPSPSPTPLALPSFVPPVVDTSPIIATPSASVAPVKTATVVARDAGTHTTSTGAPPPCKPTPGSPCF
jgi:eukaryotic-like serine/threonine-protein kinase